MKVLVINVASATDRWAFQQDQLTGLGLDFERLEAVTVDAVPQQMADEHTNDWERPMLRTEIACMLSHVKAWEQVIERNQPVLILEDDAVLSTLVPAVLAELETKPDLDHVTLETRRRKKLIAKKGTKLGPVQLHSLLLDRSGAAAYILRPSGAHKLLSRVEKGFGLTDSLIAQLWALKSFQTVPALAVQNDCLEFYNQTNAQELPTLINESGSGRDLKRSAKNRFKRILAQLKMGARQVLSLGRANSRYVEPNLTDSSNQPSHQ